MSGGRASRQKGVNAELEVVNLLRAHGIHATRVPLSGASAELPKCDVLLPDGGMVEVKRQEGLSKRFWAWLEGVDFLFMRRSQKPWLVVMPLETFVEMTNRQQKFDQFIHDLGDETLLMDPYETSGVDRLIAKYDGVTDGEDS